MIYRTAKAMRIAALVFRTDLRKRIPKDEDVLTARQGNKITDKEGTVHTRADAKAKLCPLYPQKRTWISRAVMSALWPKADSCSAAKQPELSATA